MADPVVLLMGCDADGAAPEIAPGEQATFDFGVDADFEAYSIGLLRYEAERVSVSAIFSNFEVRWTGIMEGPDHVVLRHRLVAGDVIKITMVNLSTEPVLRRVALTGWWATR